MFILVFQFSREWGILNISLFFSTLEVKRFEIFSYFRINFLIDIEKGEKLDRNYDSFFFFFSEFVQTDRHLARSKNTNYPLHLCRNIFVKCTNHTHARQCKHVILHRCVNTGKKKQKKLRSVCGSILIGSKSFRSIKNLDSEFRSRTTGMPSLVRGKMRWVECAAKVTIRKPKNEIIEFSKREVFSITWFLKYLLVTASN